MEIETPKPGSFSWALIQLDKRKSVTRKAFTDECSIKVALDINWKPYFEIEKKIPGSLITKYSYIPDLESIFADDWIVVNT